MQAPASRYAIYYTPHPESPSWRFGSDVIGYDSHAGGDRRATVWDPLADLLAPEDFAEPARYGFHATLRAPFSLREGTGVDDLIGLAYGFAAAQAPVMLPALAPALMGGFIALTCPAAPPALGRLAAECVRWFEPFRAPLGEADRQRRLRAPLSPRQMGHLDAWGYPYVMEDFVFHMTLTGRLRPVTAGEALARIEAAWKPLAGPHAIDAITVLEQPSRDAPFRILRRLPLEGRTA